MKIDEAKVRVIGMERRGAPVIELVKADGKYAIIQPEKLDADGPAIRDFIESLNQLKAEGFIDRPDAASIDLFAKPDELISWQEETGEKSTLKLAEKDGRLMAAFDARQRVYLLPIDAKAKLKKELFDFRNHRILDPDSLDAKSIEIDGLVYNNLEGTWYTTSDAARFDDKGKFKGADKDKPNEQAHIRAFMVDLEFAKTDRYIPLDDPSLKALPSAPLHRIVLSYFDQTKKSVTVDLFTHAEDPSKYLVKRSGSPFIYRVGINAFSSMTPGKGPSSPLGGEANPGLAPSLLNDEDPVDSPDSPSEENRD